MRVVTSSTALAKRKGKQRDHVFTYSRQEITQEVESLNEEERHSILSAQLYMSFQMEGKVSHSNSKKRNNNPFYRTPISYHATRDGPRPIIPACHLDCSPHVLYKHGLFAGQKSKAPYPDMRPDSNRAAHDVHRSLGRETSPCHQLVASCHRSEGGIIRDWWRVGNSG